MGVAPIPVILAAQGKGNSADGSIVRNALDDYFGTMQSQLLILLRADKINVAATSIVDALGNAITAKTGPIKNNSDSNFNSHPTITFSNNGDQYATAAGGIGIGAPPIAMPNSFTYVAGVRMTNNSVLASLYGDGLTSNGGVGSYVNTDGSFHAQVNNVQEVGVSGLFSVSTTYVFWYSYDALTKIHRWGLNSSGITGQATGSQTRTSQGTSTVCYPFGFYSSGLCGYWAFHRWALFGKAYMNGAVAADDQQFAGLIQTYKTYLGLS